MNFKNNETIYTQIADHVRKRIFAGGYARGERLPAIRDFAMFCQVNPNTIVRVYQELTEEGLIYTDSTLGKFVTSDAAFIERKKQAYVADKTKQFVASIKESGVTKGQFMELVGLVFDEKL